MHQFSWGIWLIKRLLTMLITTSDLSFLIWSFMGCHFKIFRFYFVFYHQIWQFLLFMDLYAIQIISACFNLNMVYRSVLQNMATVLFVSSGHSVHLQSSSLCLLPLSTSYCFTVLELWNSILHPPYCTVSALCTYTFVIIEWQKCRKS